MLRTSLSQGGSEEQLKSEVAGSGEKHTVPISKIFSSSASTPRQEAVEGHPGESRSHALLSLRCSHMSKARAGPFPREREASLP